MTRGFEDERFSNGTVEDGAWPLTQPSHFAYKKVVNEGYISNDEIAIDPALFENVIYAPTRSQYLGGNHERSAGRSNSRRVPWTSPGALPRPQRGFGQWPDSPTSHGLGAIDEDDPNVPRQSQQSPQQSPSAYPDPGLIDRGGLRYGFMQPTPFSESAAIPTFPEAAAEARSPASEGTNKRVTRSSRKRTSLDAGLSSADIEDDFEDATFESRPSTRRSKRTKVSPKEKGTGNGRGSRTRKVSKLEVKIAEGKAPKRGSRGPKGQVRIRGDGRMEFRDAQNPEWTLAAYHNDHRREFLDEAAQDGEFVNTPTRGEADDDETSYQPEQQAWGPSRVDWQNIVNSEGKKVMFEVEKPKSRRPPQEPSNWIHDGCVLLDMRNHPVKDWPGLNKTLSTEIESWRWEALMRMYPWLTVTDLLARMPHTRERRGEIVPLQTPQAFTNRAYRFRVPNQIPAANPKNGSATFKEGIMKNLAEKGATSTEDLSTLNHDQVATIRKANKGRFMGNSRYVVEQDEDALKSPTPSKKRKARCDDDTESESEHQAKRPCTQAPQTPGPELPNTDDLTPESNSQDINANAVLEGVGSYNEPMSFPESWDRPEQEGYTEDTADPWEGLNQGFSIPLFASIADQELALMEDTTFTSPGMVMWARGNGDSQARHIEVYWYPPNIPRHVRLDGSIEEDVVQRAFWNRPFKQGTELIQGLLRLLQSTGATTGASPVAARMADSIGAEKDPLDPKNRLNEKSLKVLPDRARRGSRAAEK